MEKNGLIYREEVPYDARLKRIRLTGKAEALNASIHREIGLIEERISHGFSEEELRALSDFLARIRENIDGDMDQ